MRMTSKKTIQIGAFHIFPDLNQKLGGYFENQHGEQINERKRRHLAEKDSW
jgi:hypothetical protein